MRDLGVIVGGLTKGKKRRPDQLLQTVPYLRVANVQRGALDLTEVKHIEATQEEVDALRLQRGDVLFNEGGDRDKLGRGCVWREELPLCIHQNHVFRLRLQSEADPQFVSAYGNSTEAQQYFLGSGKQTTNLASINITTLGALPVCLPPLNEQRRIVAKLESLQERSRRARDSLDAVPALLDKLRQSILAAAFRGDLTRDFREQHKDLEPASKLLQRIRTERRKKWEEAELAKLTAKGRPPTDDKWKSKYKEPDPVDPTGLPKLPDGWCWASVDEVTSAVRTACYGVVQPGDDCTDGVPLVRVCDLMGDGETILMHALRRIPVDVANEYDRSRIEGGELLVSVVGTIGRTAIAPVSLRGANIARAVARLVFEQMVKADWVMHWFNCSFMWHRLNLESREVARKTLNVAQLVEMPVPVAPTSEMMELCTLLRSMRTQISTIHSETAKLAEHATTLDRAILAKAFRGELVPQDPRDEPADVMLARTTASLTPAREKRGRRPGAKDAHPE